MILTSFSCLFCSWEAGRRLRLCQLEVTHAGDLGCRHQAGDDGLGLVTCQVHFLARAMNGGVVGAQHLRSVGNLQVGLPWSCPIVWFGFASCCVASMPDSRFPLLVL